MINLSEHIAKLKAAENSKPVSQKTNKNSILFWGTSFDKSYLPHLKGCVGSYTTYIRLEEISALTQIKLYCKQKGITKVISTSVPLLKKLLSWDKREAPSLSNYSGSYFTIPASAVAVTPEIEIVFIQNLKQLVTVPHGKFMAKRVIEKLTKKEKWFKPTEFDGFKLIDAANEEAYFSIVSKCFLIAIDVETFKINATIRCISYTGFWYQDNEIKSVSVVLPLDSEYNLSILRKWNKELTAPKVFQNGKYDIAYLARYNAPTNNYLYDTATMFHCMYSELPKDLGFLNSFFIREAMYWKDLSKTNDLHEYYKYNALDTWGTGNTFLAMLMELSQYAIDNYILEFPLTFPCHMCEMRGIERDMEKFAIAKKQQQDIIDKESVSLNKMLAIPEGENFNVKSSPQKKALFKILGCGDLKSQDEKNIKKARFRHPFNARILNKVLTIIKARTLISNYLTEGKEFSRLDGTGSRYLYSLNPHGTDSSRLSSKSHHFWCGDNIQKIPRGPIIKQTFKADPGFLLAEVDLEQAESRDTAYISGDEALIANVETSPDFHCANASAFFGIPFEELFDIETGEKLNKAIRDIAKNVNHGANYNMGPYVLVDTMGEENVLKAKQLLKLPRFWTYLQVAEFLLDSFHKTYPDIKGTFYEGVITEILTTKMLSSQAVHYCSNEDDYNKRVGTESKWNRYCFADPSKSKPALNSYISHPPQSLNAQTLNRAFMAVFNDIAMDPKHSENFKLLAQIHDSIFYQYRIGYEYLNEMVKERMEIPVTIKAYDGKIRTFTVPAGIKSGIKESGGIATYWSETE